MRAEKLRAGKSATEQLSDKGTKGRHESHQLARIFAVTEGTETERYADRKMGNANDRQFAQAAEDFVDSSKEPDGEIWNLLGSFFFLPSGFSTLIIDAYAQMSRTNYIFVDFENVQEKIGRAHV